jgi:hypothetical protein
MISERYVYYPAQRALELLDRANGRRLGGVSLGEGEALESPAAMIGGRVVLARGGQVYAYDER